MVFDEKNLHPDPFMQFTAWFEAASASKEADPNAMSLATVSSVGLPSTRIVLLKAYNAQGFCWFTNYASRKAQELAAKPYAALLFHWKTLERQIRIEGTVSRMTPEENAEYFQKRPRASQISAWASQQSKPIESRECLEENHAYFAEKFSGQAMTCPDFWGGYRLLPVLMEFWQGRRSRLHDRFIYTLKNGHWEIQRLQP